MVYRFGERHLQIYINDALVEAVDYELRYMGEGTNTVDEVIVIHFLDAQTGVANSTSLVFLSSTFNSLKLVNSYDDSGGPDLYFKKQP